MRKAEKLKVRRCEDGKVGRENIIDEIKQPFNSINSMNLINFVLRVTGYELRDAS